MSSVLRLFCRHVLVWMPRKALFTIRLKKEGKYTRKKSRISQQLSDGQHNLLASAHLLNIGVIAAAVEVEPIEVRAIEL
mgnify:CR=1 FL=1